MILNVVVRLDSREKPAQPTSMNVLRILVPKDQLASILLLTISALASPEWLAETVKLTSTTASPSPASIRVDALINSVGSNATVLELDSQAWFAN